MLSAIEARKEFEKLLQYLEIGINGIDYTALCTDATVHNPSDEDVQQLLDFANSAEQRRQELLKEALEEGIEEDEKVNLEVFPRKLKTLFIGEKELNNSPVFLWQKGNSGSI